MQNNNNYSQVASAISLSVKADSQTDNDSRYNIGEKVVELHGARVDVAYLGEHAIQVQDVHEEPREASHVEVVQGNTNQAAKQLNTTHWFV